MTAFYKATQPSGLSFTAPHIDYGAALLSGEVVRHPAKRKVRNDASTYLSVSVEPADCTGFEWPCRLFRVEPVGRVMAKLYYPNKRAVSALRVVEELPAHMALGPNGEQVARFIESCRTITPEQARQLSAAFSAAQLAAQLAAHSAAHSAAFSAARSAGNWAAESAAHSAVSSAAESAADAASALLVRDRITPEQFATLTAPWVSVMGETWND